MAHLQPLANSIRVRGITPSPLFVAMCVLAGAVFFGAGSGASMTVRRQSHKGAVYSWVARFETPA